jgi:RimJ/RimL family protein N-acetyltransferase
MGPDVHAKMCMPRCVCPKGSADERCGPRRGHPARPNRQARGDGRASAGIRVVCDVRAPRDRVTARPADAQSTYSILPEGKAYDDKFVFGIFVDARMVGCADLIRGYPDPGAAHLGLLLIAEEFQRQGIGAEACRQIEREIRGWGTCSRIRLGIVGTNYHVLPFWRRLGFVKTGETKPYRYANVLSETIVLEKRIA